MSKKSNFPNPAPMFARLATLAGVLLFTSPLAAQTQSWQPPPMPEEHIPSEVSIPLPDRSENRVHEASAIPSSDWPEPGETFTGTDEHRLAAANLDIPIPDMTDADNPMGFLERVGNGATGAFKGVFSSRSNGKGQFANVQFGKVLGSLAIVLGAYFGFVWLLRYFGGSRTTGLPSEVVEVMGYAPFGPKKNLQLVRLGSKLLLLINGPDGTHPLGEITDSEEVEYLASLCTGNSSRGNDSFRRVVQRVQTSAKSVPESLNELNHLVRALAKANGKSSTENVFEA